MLWRPHRPHVVLAAIVTALVVGATAGGVSGYLAGHPSGSGEPASTTSTTTAPTTTLAPTTLATTTTSPPTTVPVTADIPALVQKVTLSIVDIVASGTFIDDAGRERQGTWEGSGFVFDSSGLIATNAHVVERADTLTVTIHDGTTAVATLVGKDTAEDLAVIRIDRRDLPALTLDAAHVVRVGETVVAAGNALGLAGDPTITVGVVSGVDRSITLEDSTTLQHLIQTDAAISSGDSGGPLMLPDGMVIGINTAGASDDGTFTAQNIGFAVPISLAAGILRSLVASASGGS